MKDLYFGKPKRGKYPEKVLGDVHEALRGTFNRRTLVGKVAGVYDPLGLATPVTAKLKLDLHHLVQLKLGWDDPIDPSLLGLWVQNLKLIQEIKTVTFPRTIIPVDAKNTDVELVVSCDASQDVAIAAVHTRVELNNGRFHCQLLTAKSKLVKASSIPRAELKGAVMAAVLAHTVRRNMWNFTVTIFVTKEKKKSERMKRYDY